MWNLENRKVSWEWNFNDKLCQKRSLKCLSRVSRDIEYLVREKLRQARAKLFPTFSFLKSAFLRQPVVGRGSCVNQSCTCLHIFLRSSNKSSFIYSFEAGSVD